MNLTHTKPPEFIGIGYNFMTPRIKGYLRLKNGRAVEISEGTDFCRSAIFGVTIRPDPDNQSRMVNSMEDAEEYINELNE